MKLNIPYVHGIGSQSFNKCEQIAALDIPMCVPIEFGICDDSVYSIRSWSAMASPHFATGQLHGYFDG